MTVVREVNSLNLKTLWKSKYSAWCRCVVTTIGWFELLLFILLSFCCSIDNKIDIPQRDIRVLSFATQQNASLCCETFVIIAERDQTEYTARWKDSVAFEAITIIVLIRREVR